MTEWDYCPQCAKSLVQMKGDEGVARPSCPDGHFVKYDNPVLCAGAILERDGKYLVLKRAIEPSKGEWNIPGGFVDGAEHPSKTVLREIKEETGLSARIVRQLGIFMSVYGDTGIKTAAAAYVCQTDDGEIDLSSESSEYRWVSVDEFPPMAHADDQQTVEAFQQEQSAKGR